MTLPFATLKGVGLSSMIWVPTEASVALMTNAYADKMTSVQNIPVKRVRVTVMMIQNVKAHLSVDT